MLLMYWSLRVFIYYHVRAKGEIQYDRAILTPCGGEPLIQTGSLHRMYAEVEEQYSFVDIDQSAPAATARRGACLSPA